MIKSLKSLFTGEETHQNNNQHIVIYPSLHSEKNNKNSFNIVGKAISLVENCEMGKIKIDLTMVKGDTEISIKHTPKKH